jgi:flavin reductase (DIM6/NTAB) family NADH-FMN oxidoreductase RutF
MDVRVRGGRRSRRPATLSSGVPPTRPEDARPMTVQHVDPALQDRFREVMAQVPTPVSVVTSMGDGLPHGTTVSAFASLSMTPPMVLVSLDRGSDLLALVRETGRFGVNVLGAEQSALALAFARKGGTGKFDGIRWEVADGLPRLPGAPGWLAAEVETLVDGGDHVVALGRVTAAESTAGRPLTYHGRIFGTHAALEAE